MSPSTLCKRILVQVQERGSINPRGQPPTTEVVGLSTTTGPRQRPGDHSVISVDQTQPGGPKDPIGLRVRGHDTMGYSPVPCNCRSGQ